MYEIDGTAYKNRSTYKRCLEKMKTSSKRTIRTLIRLHNKTTDPTYRELIEEAHRVELNRLAYAHFNLAWLKNPDKMKHYPAAAGESEGAQDDTCRS